MIVEFRQIHISVKCFVRGVMYCKVVRHMSLSRQNKVVVGINLDGHYIISKHCPGTRIKKQ